MGRTVRTIRAAALRPGDRFRIADAEHDTRRWLVTGEPTATLESATHVDVPVMLAPHIGGRTANRTPDLSVHGDTAVEVEEG